MISDIIKRPPRPPVTGKCQWCKFEDAASRIEIDGKIKVICGACYIKRINDNASAAHSL